jgi:hypothetical protein
MVTPAIIAKPLNRFIREVKVAFTVIASSAFPDDKS